MSGRFNMRLFKFILTRASIALMLVLSLSACTFSTELVDSSGNSSGPTNPNPPDPNNDSPILISSLSPLCNSYDTTTSPTPIYRSMGFNNEKPLALGEKNPLRISNSVALFTLELPDRIGIGDAIEYDSNGDGSIDSLAFIHCRDSNQRYILRSANGGDPVEVSSTDHWNIYRAYISLNDAQNGAENPGITDSLENFDDWTDGKDLIAAEQEWYILPYADAIVTTSVRFQNWNTDTNHYLHVYVPHLPNEVGISQRHGGAFSEDLFLIDYTTTSTFQSAISIRASVPYIHLEGLQIRLNYSHDSSRALSMETHSDPNNNMLILNNIIQGRTSTNGITGIGIRPANTNGLISAVIANNIVQDFISADSTDGIAIAVTGQSGRRTLKVLNNTVYNSYLGFSDGIFQSGDVINNIAQNCVVGFSGSFNSSSDYNVSNTADAPGANSADSATVVFRNAAAGDFRLHPGDTVAKGQGIDLSPLEGFPKGDIRGLTRPATFDIGAMQSTTSSTVVAAKFPTNGPDWNDYVLNGSGDMACDPNSDTDCIHAGPLRRVEIPASYTSCEGLTLKDSQDALHWVCNDSASPIVFESTGFKTGKGLASLVNVNSWKPFTAKLFEWNELVDVSTFFEVWSNPVVELPDNSASAALLLDGVDDDGGGIDQAFLPKTIFTLGTSRTTEGYNINMDKASLVTLGESVLQFNGSGLDNFNENTGEGASPDHRGLVTSGGNHHIWIEGRFDGNNAINAETGLFLTNSNYHTIHNVEVSGNNNWALHLDDTSFNQVSNAILRDNGRYGLFYYNGSSNQAVNVTSYRNGERGLRINFNSDNNIFKNFSISESGDFGVAVRASNFNVFENFRISQSNDSGVYIEASNNLVFKNFQIHNSVNHGIWLDQTGNAPISFINTTVTNSQNNGVYNSGSNQLNLHNVTLANNDIGYSTTSGAENTLSSIFAINNSTTGIGLEVGASSALIHNVTVTNSGTQNFHDLGTGNNFKGYAVFGSAGSADCNMSNNGNMTHTGGICETVDSELNLVAGQNGDGSFNGQVLSDARNPDISLLDASGFLDVSAITNWMDFNSSFRAWGQGKSTTQLDASNQRACLTGNCAIWDWSLNTSALLVFNKSGDGQNPNEDFVEGESCPDAVHGNQAVTDQRTSPNTYLANATEILFDQNGDDDGLCESNEACIYSPHIGGYQGQGDHTLKGTCQFEDGTVTGVTMYSY